MSRKLIGFLGCALVVVCPGSVGVLADAPQGKPMDPAKIRRDLEKVRADLERQRLQREKAPAPRAASASSTGTSPDRKEPLGYRIRAGDKFAYQLMIETRGEGSKHVERYRGTPHFTVMDVEPDGAARVLVIGKLTCFQVSGEDGAETPHPSASRTIWMGSRLELGPLGPMGGRDDVHADRLPDFLVKSLGFRPWDMIFPRLTQSLPGELSSSGTASLWVSQSGALGLRHPAMVAGTETQVRKATVLAPRVARVENARGFQAKPPSGPNAAKAVTAEMKFQLLGRFDRERGMPIDATGTGRCEFEDRRPALVTVQVRRLAGAEYEAAAKQSLADWSEMPAELNPIEFRRERVSATHTRALASFRDARPGMPVVHYRCDGNGTYDDADRRYYRADILELGDPSTKRVKIRYRGSNEVIQVSVSQLYPPDR